MAELQYLPLKSDANLRAYYRFYAGSLTTDSSGNSKTLTNNNSVAESTSGKYTGCADLGTPNTTKYFSISDALGLSRHAQSISFWVKCNADVSAGDTWYEFFSSNNNTYKDGLTGYYYYNSGTPTIGLVYYRNGVVAAGEITYNTTLGTTNWHHYVATWTGDNTSNGLKLYLNGSLVAQGTATTGTGTTANDAFCIGARIGGTFGNADVKFDDFCVFDKILSSDEVLSLYNDLPATTNSLKQYRRTRIPGSITGI